MKNSFQSWIFMSISAKPRTYHPNEPATLWAIFRKIAIFWGVVCGILVLMALFLASKYYDLLMLL